jgi:Protein of unknown function (DUF2800)
MSAHSILVGGSIAARRLNCPASFQEQLKQPQGVRVSSSYADRGTMLHEVMSTLLTNAKKQKISGGFISLRAVPYTQPNGQTLTKEDIAEAIDPTLNALDQLMMEHGGGFTIAAIEATVRFPGLPAAYGTVDLILQSKTHVLIVDFKFGQGVPVKALYVDPDNGDIVNEQLAYYATAALHSQPKLFTRNRKIILAIIQPAFEPIVTQTETTREELADFATALHRAIDEALTDAPRYARGDWCRFAECKSTCSLWTGPLLDLSALDPNRKALASSDLMARAPTTDKRNAVRDEWGAYLASAKRLVDSAVLYKKTIDEMLMQHLRDGGKAPGFALKAYVADRKWLDDAEHVATELKALGLKSDEIWRKQLQTFKVVDAAAKRRKVEIPPHLRPRPDTGALVLTAEDDPDRIDISKHTDQFRAALAALKR